MYQYTGLGPEGSNFRLLRLLKGSGPRLECELSPHSLQNLHLPYEALSYTWGSSEFVECIKLDEKPFWVTDNLHAALQSLRFCDRDRILWIDAICINQEDKVEQSQQVQQMGQIFEKAERVLFWLGKATPQMIALMDTLNQSRNPDSGDYSKQETSKDWSWKHHSVAIKQILNREWFTRVWILQEAAKARRADVCCGTRSIPAEIFALALFTIKQEPPPHCQPVLEIMAESSRSGSWWAQTRDLRTLLRKFQASKATDERDKIYALLGMSSDPLDTKSLAIDYRRPTSQVVHEAMTYLLQSTQADPFTIHDVLNTMCFFTTLDVTYFVPAPDRYSGLRDIYSHSEYKPMAPDQNKAKFPDIPVVNDARLLLFEDRQTENLENPKTCYSQVVELMLDQQPSRATEYERGLQILLWGNMEHHVKVVVIYHKKHAISNAIRGNYDQVVRQLLRLKGIFGGERGCEAFALQQAAHLGRTGILRLILDEGVDVNSQYGEDGTALQAAAAVTGFYQGREEIIKILLDAGADVHAQGGKYGNALQAAAFRASGKVIDILLDAGADVNAQGGVYGNALQAAAAAASHYGEKVVKILLDAGADVNAQGGKYGNALQAASTSLYGKEIMKILLDAGADVNAQGGECGNALQAAATSPYGKETVKILLDAGADVNAQGGECGNALIAAIKSHKEEVVKILLEAGADVNAQGRYGNALQAAFAAREERVVRMLLDAGAEDRERILSPVCTDFTAISHQPVEN